MTQHIVIPLPKGVSITTARRAAVEVEAAIARVTGTTTEATVTDLHLTDQERRVLRTALDISTESAGFATPSAAFDTQTVDTLADLRDRVDPDGYGALMTDVIRGPLPHPEELSRPQELAADAMASEYGRSRVRHVADGAVVITGMTDDVERRSVCIERDGRERWRA